MLNFLQKDQLSCTKHLFDNRVSTGRWKPHLTVKITCYITLNCNLIGFSSLNHQKKSFTICQINRFLLILLMDCVQWKHICIPNQWPVQKVNIIMFMETIASFFFQLQVLIHRFLEASAWLILRRLHDPQILLILSPEVSLQNQT